jgi:hypothetical protein
MSLLEEVMNKIVNEDIDKDARYKAEIESLAETIEIPSDLVAAIRERIEQSVRIWFTYIPSRRKFTRKNVGHKGLVRVCTIDFDDLPNVVSDHENINENLVGVYEFKFKQLGFTVIINWNELELTLALEDNLITQFNA